MTIGEEILKQARKYAGKKYKKHNNQFTKHFAGKYGVKKNGYYPMGWCTLFDETMYDKCGALKYLPMKALGKHASNTAYLYKKLKKQGKIVTDPRKAKAGELAFKKVGSTKKKTSGHTGIFWKYEKGYVYTIDGNIKNKVVVRKKSPIWYLGFSNVLPKETKKKTEPYTAGRVYKLQADMNVRADHSTKSKRLGIMLKGKQVAPLKVYKTNNGAYWLQVPYKDKVGWVCAKTPKKTYVK